MKIYYRATLLVLAATLPIAHARVGRTRVKDTVAICHLRGNGDMHTINVDANAVQAHLDHGDTLGECVDQSERICPGPYTFPNGETELGYDVSVTWASADTNMIAKVYFYDDNNNMISTNDNGDMYGLLGPPYPPGSTITTFKIAPIASCLTDKILIEPYSFTGPQNPPDERPWLVTRIALYAASVEGGAFNKVVEFKLKGGELLIDNSYYLYADRYPKLV